MTTGLQRHVAKPFQRYIEPWFAGKPCRYLELGVYAGGTARWMLETVLTHDQSRCDLVDPWEPYEAEKRSDGKPRIYEDENIQNAERLVLELAAEFPDKCEVHKMTSQAFLTSTQRTFDFIFVDGLHDYQSVLDDALGSLKVLDNGGLIAFDDCDQHDVRQAVDDFLPVASRNGVCALFYHTKHQRCYRIWKV